MRTTIIGIDCATQDKKVGLARGRFDGNELTIEHADVCGRELDSARTVARWIRESSRPVLIAIDAPLGWPFEMKAKLAIHKAGVPIPTPPNDFFRRETDRQIKTRVKKMPLDVGADRIARTAHMALELLRKVGKEIDEPVELAWNSTLGDAINVIEVYPGATLLAYGFPSGGYKNPDALDARKAILQHLSGVAAFDLDIVAMEGNADALDAAVCLVAARDFLLGLAAPPQDVALAESEGWIWCRDPIAS